MKKKSVCRNKPISLCLKCWPFVHLKPSSSKVRVLRVSSMV